LSSGDLSSRFFVEHNDKVSAEIFADIWLYQLWQWLGDVVDHRVWTESCDKVFKKNKKSILFSSFKLELLRQTPNSSLSRVRIVMMMETMIP